MCLVNREMTTELSARVKTCVEESGAVDTDDAFLEDDQFEEGYCDSKVDPAAEWTLRTAQVWQQFGRNTDRRLLISERQKTACIDSSSKSTPIDRSEQFWKELGRNVEKTSQFWQKFGKNVARVMLKQRREEQRQQPQSTMHREEKDEETVNDMSDDAEENKCNSSTTGDNKQPDRRKNALEEFFDDFTTKGDQKILRAIGRTATVNAAVMLMGLTGGATGAVGFLTGGAITAKRLGDGVENGDEKEDAKSLAVYGCATGASVAGQALTGVLMIGVAGASLPVAGAIAFGVGCCSGITAGALSEWSVDNAWNGLNCEQTEEEE